MRSKNVTFWGTPEPHLLADALCQSILIVTSNNINGEQSCLNSTFKSAWILDLPMIKFSSDLHLILRLDSLSWSIFQPWSTSNDSVQWGRRFTDKGSTWLKNVYNFRLNASFTGWTPRAQYFEPSREVSQYFTATMRISMLATCLIASM